MKSWSRLVALGALCFMGACHCANRPVDETPDRATATQAANQAHPPSRPAASECPTEKIAFDQEHGCLNDGGVEFCVAKDDTTLVDEIRAIAPKVHCARGAGRARCDLETERLCFFPTGSEECTKRHGALKDRPWKQLCQIASLPRIKKIVATWLE